MKGIYIAFQKVAGNENDKVAICQDMTDLFSILRNLVFISKLLDIKLNFKHQKKHKLLCILKHVSSINIVNASNKETLMIER